MVLVDLIVHAYVVLILYVAYLALRRAESQRKDEVSDDTKEFVISSPQLKQALNEVDRANEISDNALLLLVNLKEQVNKAVTDITGLKQSLNSIQGSTQRFDRILFDPQAKGALGERFVADQLSTLPQDWIRHNVPFPNGTRVEFCVLTFDKRLIPIDSKWPATGLLDKLGQTTDKDERVKLEKAIKTEVWKRGLEVTKYLDDDRTIGFGIAAVPDSVFALCSDVQPYLVKRNIVLISYSLLVPYILLLVKLFLSNAQGIQAMQISQILESALTEIEQIQEFIDTDLRKPLDTIKEQQSEYRLQNERLQEANEKLTRIENELTALRNILPNTVTTLINSEISSLPDELKHRVSELRKSLAEIRAKQNEHVTKNIDPKPIEEKPYEPS